MIIFKSQQVNLDSNPYVSNIIGLRRPAPTEYNPSIWVYDPRPEFEPTRDPKPWIVGDRAAGFGGDRVALTPEQLAHFRAVSDEKVMWAPRHERFDTPVNRVLVAFRADDAGEPLAETARGWLNGGSMGDGYATPEEIEHARKVLTRLAAF